MKKLIFVFLVITKKLTKKVKKSPRDISKTYEYMPSLFKLHTAYLCDLCNVHQTHRIFFYKKPFFGFRRANMGY